MKTLNSFCDPWRKMTWPDQKGATLQRESDPVTEDAIAADLHSLTVQERQAITDEIHGVGNSVVEETVERVQEALKKLREDYLSNQNHNFMTVSTDNAADVSHQHKSSHSSKREAYDRAVFLRPMLAKDDKLHLMFLRAQRFDPCRAAQHIFLYFENKRALFGDKLLTQKITLKDLTDHEVRLVREGTNQLLAGRERSGRGIAYYRMGQWDLSVPLALIRSVWYILTAIEDDEDMQRHGVVIIGDWQGPFRHSPYEIFAFFHKVQGIVQRSNVQSWTFRTESVHTLYGNGNFEALFKALAAVVSKNIRVRHRYHFGSQLETMYSLRTFGIDMGEGTPSSKSSGSILPGSNVKTMDEYVQKRVQAEEQWREKEKVFHESSAVIALVPNSNDILMGRSKIAATWPGNVLYHTVIAHYAPRYIDPESKFRIDKTLLTLEVIHALQKDYGSRFLSRKETRWVVAEDAEIQKRVSQSLRLEARSSMGKHPPRRLSDH